MQDFNDFRAAYTSFSYTRCELEIIHGIKTEISARAFFKLLEKTHRLQDIWTHDELFTSFEIDGKIARRCKPYGQF